MTFAPMLIRNIPVTENMLNRLQGLIAQPKIDGVRLCFMRPEEGSADQSSLDRLRIWTRSNQRISPRLYHILDEVLPSYTSGAIIDGELVYKNDCAATTGILHSKTVDIDPSALRFFAFDVIDPDGEPKPFAERLAELDDISTVESFSWSPARVLPHWQHRTAQESYERARIFCDALDLPFEGYVLKPRGSLYVCGRRLEGSYKYKVCKELTGVVLAVHPQVGQDHVAKDLAGIIEVQVGAGADAAIVNVTASCDNALRAKIMEHAGHLTGFPIKFRVFSCPSGNTDTAALRMPRYVSGLEFLLNIN